MFIIMGSLISLLTSAQENNSNDNKISLGGGLTTILRVSGGNLKFDYYLNNKLSLGIRNKDTYEGTDFGGYGNKSKSGYIFNVSFVGNYYLLGNSSSTKWGFYATAGLGYSILQRMYFDYETNKIATEL